MDKQETLISATQRRPWSPPEDVARLGDGLIIDLISAFETDTRLYIAQLAGSLSEQNLAAAKFQAHKIRGSACQIGADRLTSLCEEIESTVNTASVADLDARIAELHSEYLELCSDMDTYLLVAGASV